jgi:indolepyruvate ferredoxin oxidoreductase
VWSVRTTIADRVGRAPLFAFDAHDYAVALFGDSIASNMFLLGYAYQKGFVPVGSVAIEQAIELNGAAIEMNRRAFRFGRLAAHDVAALDRIAKPAAKIASKPKTLDDLVAFRAEHLTKYQDAALADRYRAKVTAIAALEAAKTPGKSGLAEAVARSYHKLLAIKDEYEVARLYTDSSFKAALNEQFEATGKLEFHVAPPFLAWFHKDKVTGHPRKIKLGAWMLPVFGLLAKGKRLRGSALDVFGLSAERRLERQMIADYDALLAEIGDRLTAASHATAVALASVPEEIKGFGHVKAATYATAKKREADLLKRLRAAPAPVRQAAE